MMMTVDNVYNYKNKNAFWVPDQTPQSAVGQNRNQVLPVLATGSSIHFHSTGTCSNSIIVVITT